MTTLHQCPKCKAPTAVYEYIGRSQNGNPQFLFECGNCKAKGYYPKED